MALEFFEDAIGQLVENLPAWWATAGPGELRILLEALAELVDELSEQIEGIYADQALSTARDEALRSEWAPLYGVSREDLPLETENLRAYLQARAQEDGSVASLEGALLAILHNPSNDVGSELVFPAAGGLTFPADGSGLTLFERAREALRFPADGTGLIFPEDGSGLIFTAATSWLEISEATADDRLDVTVRDFLVFDRAAFARAVNRFRFAHMFAPTITETPTS